MSASDMLSRPFHSRAALLAPALALMLAACGGSGDGGTHPVQPVQPGPPSAVNVVTGNAQQGTVGEELSAPLVVRVVDAAGNGVAGQSVSFVVTEGGGSVYAGAAITNATGQAQERWTLGTVAGPQKLEARAVDPQTGAKLLFATFTANAAAGPISSLVKVAGDAQTAAGGTQLPTTLAVRGTDRYGNAISTGSVTWTVASGGGFVTPAQSAFDAQGSAQAVWTVGLTTGSQSLTATVGALSATFTATSTAPPPPQRWVQMSSPTLRTLRDVWGTSATDVWAVGEGGTIVRYDGSVWKSMPSGTTETLVRVWGTSASNVYAIGADNATLLHFNGAVWAPVAAPPPLVARGQQVRYWVNSPTDALALLRADVGADSVMHWDGSGWTTVLRGVASGSALWMAPDGRALVGQVSGQGWRFDGTSWQTAGLPSNVGSITGKSYADVGLTVSGTGRCCEVWHFNGTTATKVSGASVINGLTKPWFASPTESFAFNFNVHYPDSENLELVRITANSYMGSHDSQGIFGRAIWGASPTAIFVVGSDGKIYHRAS